MLAALQDQLTRRPGSPFFADLNRRAPPSRRYMIATTARSGSTFLCARISEYARLGFPMEFLNESYVAQFDALFPSPSLSDFEAFVVGSFTSKQGVFGLKTDWWRFQQARELQAMQALVRPLDLIVKLYREDFVAQAVSLALAVATQVWHSRDASLAPLEALHEAVPFDAEAIKEHAANILNQEYLWREYIETAGAPCLALSYETVSRDVDGAVAQIAAALGARLGPVPPSANVISRQQTRVSRLWVERFNSECGDYVSYWRDHRGRVTAA
ncbi:MAG: Stf0 family sulfotransferase [Phenylobacterium sp.]